VRSPRKGAARRPRVSLKPLPHSTPHAWAPPAARAPHLTPSSPPPPCSSVDWCEHNYLYSPYVAEWWNTLTSFPIFALALYGFIIGVREGYSKRVLAPLLLMSVVGFGSMCFHGTLQKWGQAIDELAMIWAAAALAFAVYEIDVKVRRLWLAPALVAYCASFSVAYFFLPEYFVWFLLSYIVLVLILFVGALRFCGSASDGNVRTMLGVAAVMYAGGFFLLWLPDKLLCEKVQDWCVCELPPSRQTSAMSYLSRARGSTYEPLTRNSLTPGNSTRCFTSPPPWAPGI